VNAASRISGTGTVASGCVIYTCITLTDTKHCISVSESNSVHGVDAAIPSSEVKEPVFCTEKVTAIESQGAYVTMSVLRFEYSNEEYDSP